MFFLFLLIFPFLSHFFLIPSPIFVPNLFCQGDTLPPSIMATSLVFTILQKGWCHRGNEFTLGIDIVVKTFKPVQTFIIFHNKYSGKHTWPLGGTAPLYSLKLANFVCNLKIINTFLRNDICFLKQIVQGTKNGIEIMIGQMIFKLWIKTVKILFWSITQEPLGLLEFQCYFGVPWRNYYTIHIIFFKKVFIIIFLDTCRAQNMLILWLGVQFSLKVYMF